MAFGDFTVTRSTTKWVLNSAGVLSEVAINTPAFEFNTDGTYRGLLVEPAATNLFQRSQEFDNAYWSKVNSTVTANASVAPDGTTTADKLIANTTNGQHRIDLTSTTTAAVHTFSIWGKASGYNFISLRMGSRAAAFSLTSGTTGSVEASTTARVETWPNGFFRVSISGDAGLNSVCQINIENTLTVGGSFAGNDVDGIEIWGAQLETGSVATSYIPTVASTVTRTADTVSLTGASSLIGQTEGTVYAEFEYLSQTPVGSNVIFGINVDGVSDIISNGIFLGTFAGTTNLRFRISSGGSNTADITVASGGSGIKKMAGAYAANDAVLYYNGSQAGTDATVTVGANSQVYMNFSPVTTRTQVMWIRSVALFPTRLANAQLATLTT